MVSGQNVSWTKRPQPKHPKRTFHAKRRSTRPEIASIVPHGGPSAQGCSSEAVVTTTSRAPARKTAIIIAEDTVSGVQLRCDVIVDEIFKIEIETTTHELFLDDSPEEFLIRASNEEGDIFSSLEAHHFEWSLQPDLSTTSSPANLPPAQTVLRFLPFVESSYSAMEHIRTLEAAGKRGDRILVKGIKSGLAKVTARLEDPSYKKVKEASERIVVMANIQLNPPVVYLLTYAEVVYKVELIKQTQIQEISMPSGQYSLEIDDVGIATMDAKTSIATAQKIGTTDVKLKDRHITIPGIFREPSAAIYVVTPGYLEFVVLPDRNWVLLSQNVYIIIIEIYDKESHKIMPSDNVRVVADFPKDYFDVQYSTLNGTYHIVKTLQRGFPTIEGTLRAIVLQDGSEEVFDPQIQGAQDVEIYDPVQVTPKLIILPWDAVRRTPMTYQLQATGGSGNYSWQSSRPDVGAVNMKGVVSTAMTTGDTRVMATDARNPKHFDTMEVYVLPPGDMEFLPSRVEAEIGTVLDLPLAVYGIKDGQKMKFAECLAMPFDARIGDKTIFTGVEESSPIEDGSCVNIRVKATGLGHTQVTVHYRYLDNELSASVTIAAYRPLKAVDPAEYTLVTPGSSRELIFEGGPQPWVLAPETFLQKATAEDRGLVKLSPVKGYESQKIQHVFRGECRNVGEQTISLSVENRPSSKNKFPAKATATVRFACADPGAIRLTPLVPRPIGLPPCPISAEFDEPVPVYNNRNLNMLVTVSDKDGRRFDNFSSVILDWQLSDESLAKFYGEDNLITETTSGDDRKILSFRPMSMKGKVGLLTVSATVARYNTMFIKGISLTMDAPVSSSRGLDLVEEAVINPGFLTIYNHQTTKPGLKIEKGSGHFSIDTAKTQLAMVKYDSKSRLVNVSPQEEGQFSVTAYDLCLDALTPARATVFISDVHQIQLSVVDKVEIHNEIEAKVQVVDRSGKPIPLKFFPTMDVKPALGSDIINIRSLSDHTSEDDTVAHYLLTGLALGRTTLQFSANQKTGKVVPSPSREIQVFPPLRLADRNITLIVGALFQITAHGGPQPQSTIEFSLSNATVGDVSQAGLFNALEVGVTEVVGRAVGVNGEAGDVVYSMDRVTVTVISLEGIRIFTPMKLLQSGTEMPLYAIGSGNDNETPFTFGSAQPPLRFYWSISNEDVAKLKPLFYKGLPYDYPNDKSGITPNPENNFAARFFAEEPGHVTVRLEVKMDINSKEQMLPTAKVVDTVQIQVFERLQLVSPAVCDGTLLITPDTETRLKTNREGSAARVTYSVQHSSSTAGTTTDGATSVGNGADVTVDEYGHLVTGSRTGDASLLVTAHEEFRVNQTLVIHIKVRPISYVMINVDSVIKTRGQHLAVVPVGSMLYFTVSFHDTVGEKFFATNSKIAYRPNRFDLFQISHGSNNDTLVGKATNVGSTVLKVWDKTSPGRLVDYVNIEVGYAVQPAQTHVLLGDVICFNSPLVSTDSHPGTWSAPQSALEVEADSGIALASHPGTAIVQYNVSASTVTHTQVTVSHIYRVKLENKDIEFLTNVASKYKSNVVGVQLEDQHGRASSTVHGANCSQVLSESGFRVYRLPVRCEVNLERRHPHVAAADLVTATAEFDVESGQYQCTLSQSTPHDVQQNVAGLDLSVQLRAVVGERDSQREVSSPLLTLPFIPAFFPHASDLQVSDALPTANLRVTAAPRVRETLKVTSSDPSLIKVLSPETQPDNTVSYPISLQLSKSLWDRNQLEATIEVSSSLTGQEKMIPVRVKLVAKRGDDVKTVPATWGDLLMTLANNYHNIIFMLLCVIATVSCIVIAYHAVLGQRYQAASNTSGVFLSPGRSPAGSPWASASPQSSSPASSPRLWSVDYGPYDSSHMFKRSPHHSPSPTGH